jgi:ABC-type molybdate transport system substrate-binding protein
MAVSSRKTKRIIQATVLTIILFFLTVVAKLAITGTYANYTPKYRPPDPKESIHIAADGSLTAPTTYNETIPDPLRATLFVLF